MSLAGKNWTLEDELQYIYGDLLKDDKFRMEAEALEKRHRREDAFDKWFWGIFLSTIGSLLAVSVGMLILDAIFHFTR